VRRVDAISGIITTVAGSTYMTEYDRDCQSGGDNGPATKAQLCSPQAVALDGAGDLYIADTDNHLIRKVMASTGVITTVAGTRYGGLYGAAANGSPATIVNLLLPTGIAIDSEKNIYIADQVGCLVRKVTASTGRMTAVAGVYGTGVSEYCSATVDGVLATSSPLYFPLGVALDSAGNLFIADSDNDLIRRVDAKTRIITTVAGDESQFGSTQSGPEYNGIFGYTGDQGSATVAQLDYPTAVALDKSENLYIADEGNSAIRKVTGTRSTTTSAPLMTPVATAEGYGFASSVQVTLGATAVESTIYYTTDGTTPTTASKTYAGPITLSHSGSVIAFAAAAGKPNSDAVEGNYFQLPAPTISPDGGSFTKPQSVLLTLPVLGGIFYTLDGSDPCTSNTAGIFDEPIAVSSSLTLTAAARLGGGCGKIATAHFTIPSAPVVVTGQATSLAATTVTLNGTVNPGLLATKYWFAYGKDCATLPQKTAEASLAASNTVHSVSAKLTGLTANTPYCFEIVASNADGQETGQRGSFTTAK
jgi:hypothetical protein